MKLHFYRHAGGEANFGDDLNPWLWRQLLGDVLDDDDSTIVLGAGTLLNSGLARRLPTGADRVVLGSGAGYGPPPGPGSGLGRWRIYWLRGPLSAAALGLEPALAITDPAMLLARFIARADQPSAGFAYMPHLSSARAGSGQLKALCGRLGVRLIDPRQPVEQVAAAIGSSQTLLTEALHGAVVADALRIRWIPVKSTTRLLDFKWHDWCRSLGITYRPQVLPQLWDPEPGSRLVDRSRKRVKLALLEARLRWVMARARPSLSDEPTHHRLIERMAERCERFRADVRAGAVFMKRGCDLQARRPLPAGAGEGLGVPLTVGPMLGEQAL